MQLVLQVLRLHQVGQHMGALYLRLRQVLFRHLQVEVLLLFRSRVQVLFLLQVELLFLDPTMF